jgi:hypothetical protein
MPILVAVALLFVLLTAVAITYLAGGFHDDGRFAAEPPACTTVEASLPLLGTDYDSKQTGANNCELLYPPDHPDYIPHPKINIQLYVATPRREDASEAASRLLKDLGTSFQPLPGIGEEAYVRNRDVFFRVSNLVVGVVVYPLQDSSDEQVHAFAADLADRLATT